MTPNSSVAMTPAGATDLVSQVSVLLEMIRSPIFSVRPYELPVVVSDQGLR